MTTFIKGLALLVAVSCLAWISVLWHWRASAHSPTTNDLLSHMVLLPLAGFGLLLLLMWGWRAAAEKRSALAAAPAAAAGDAANAAARSEPPPPPPPLQLLRAELLCGCADSVDALLAAAKEGKPLPGLDAELRNGEGLPVMSVRIADLPLDDTLALLKTLTPEKSVQADDSAGGAPATIAGTSEAPELPDHVVRALAALSAPLAKALQGLQPWWPLIEAEQKEAQQAGGSSQKPERGLDLLLGWPERWTETDRAQADAWVRAQLANASMGPIDPARCRIASVATGGVELWVEAQRRLRESVRDRRPRALLVASAHSDLSDGAVAALEGQGRLFAPATHPKGLMPSEAAAALLLAPHDWPAPPDDALPPVLLQPAVALRREKSIEAAGSVSSQTLVEVLGGAIGLAGLEAALVAKVVCDADRHSQRGTELFGATLKALPQLDAAEDLCLTAAVAGHGNPGALMVVAGAAACAAADQKPCLGLALGDPHWRLALVAVPAPAPAA